MTQEAYLRDYVGVEACPVVVIVPNRTAALQEAKKRGLRLATARIYCGYPERMDGLQLHLLTEPIFVAPKVAESSVMRDMIRWWNIMRSSLEARQQCIATKSGKCRFLSELADELL